jgi:hypothetical protein
VVGGKADSFLSFIDIWRFVGARSRFTTWLE